MKLRAPKKANKDREGRSASSSSARKGFTLFFDTIPKEILGTALRFLSLLPNAVNWTKYLQMRCINELVRVRGGLASFVKGRFRILCISKTLDCRFEQEKHKWKVPDEGVLWTIHGFSFSEDDVRRMRDHCPNLKEIDLRTNGENEIILEFNTSYGNQLDLVHIFRMTESELKRIVEACRNARFHIDAGYRPDILLPTLTIVGPQLEKIEFGIYEYEVDGEEWRAAWNLCTNLQVLHENDLSVEIIRSIMATPKLDLQEIRINFLIDYDGEYEGREDKSFMDVVADGTSNLEKLYFGNYEHASPNTFDTFINKNLVTLWSVTIGSRDRKILRLSPP